MDEFCCLNSEISDRLYSIPWKTSYNVKAETDFVWEYKNLFKTIKVNKSHHIIT